MKKSFTVFFCTCLSILILLKSTTLSQDYALSFNSTNQYIVPAIGKDVNYVNSELPTLSITEVKEIYWNGADCSATITNLGVPNPTQHGFCWGPSNPTILNNKNQLGPATSTGEFIAYISVPTSLTSYYVRAYATNDAGTSYGEQVQFTTLCHPPDPPTVTCSDITVNSARVRLSTIQQYLYDCYDPSHPNYPTYSASWYVDGQLVGTAEGSEILITGLQANTSYVVRGYAECWDPTCNPYTFGVGSFTTLSELPVELVSFNGYLTDEGVLLEWATSTEINNYGFDIESRIENAEWKSIGFVEGRGNSNSINEYCFIDKPVKKGKYFYRLKQIDNDGSFEYSNIIEVTIEAPDEFFLAQNFPNPFNPVTTIQYSIPERAQVQIKILSIMGEEITTLIHETKEAGKYFTDFNGNSLPSGVYFYRMQVGNIIDTKKFVLLK
ncbi:MAG: T9SS C-terminal target domain-containing protein [Ignavibacteriales bacterium]|nr:MAG: T9SS C-terminal target domain-containing protein [Ignavibacteriales bacterium]